jgi:hypothetical protein
VNSRICNCVSAHNIGHYETVVPRAGFKREQQGQSPWGLQKTEIESIDFIETFASLKS